jgi:hypothetical protein
VVAVSLAGQVEIVVNSVDLGRSAIAANRSRSAEANSNWSRACIDVLLMEIRELGFGMVMM